MVPQDHHPIPPRSCLFLPKSQFFGTQVPASFPGIRSSSFLVFVLKAREHSPATIANPSTWVLGLVFVLGEGAFPCDHRPSQHMSVGTKAKELSIVTIANPSTWVLGLGSGFVPVLLALTSSKPWCLCVFVLNIFPAPTSYRDDGALIYRPWSIVRGLFSLSIVRGLISLSIVRGHTLFLTGIIIDCPKT